MYQCKKIFISHLVSFLIRELLPTKVYLFSSEFLFLFRIYDGWLHRQAINSLYLLLIVIIQLYTVNIYHMCDNAAFVIRTIFRLNFLGICNKTEQTLLVKPKHTL